MINIKELKIGNNVWLNEKITKTEKQVKMFVLGINKDSVLVSNGRSEFTVTTDLLDPIPIDKEVLITEGFDERCEAFKEPDYVMYIFNDSLRVIYQAGKFIIDSVADNKRLLIAEDIKFVHEFQNLIQTYEKHYNNLS